MGKKKVFILKGELVKLSQTTQEPVRLTKKQVQHYFKILVKQDSYHIIGHHHYLAGFVDLYLFTSESLSNVLKRYQRISFDDGTTFELNSCYKEVWDRPLVIKS